MKYSLFYTDRPISERDYLANKSQYIRYVYNELDDAFGMAREIAKRGGVPWEIEGDDGTKLGREEISKTLRVRSRELAGRPKIW